MRTPSRQTTCRANDRVLATVGRLAEGKGHGVLLDAVEALDVDVGSVCIVGDGPLYEELETEIS
ncbi:MAG: hypothetical protein U5K28_10295 [Halobacteriales archaeon]|nr:hypothetical protein [Halobacteriales archaeon]